MRRVCLFCKVSYLCWSILQKSFVLLLWKLPDWQKICRSAQSWIAHQKTQQGAGAGQSSEQAQQNTNAQCCGKSLDQTCAEEKQGCAADQCGEMTIHD